MGKELENIKKIGALIKAQLREIHLGLRQRHSQMYYH
jgi:hypothetical protein